MIMTDSKRDGPGDAGGDWHDDDLSTLWTRNAETAAASETALLRDDFSKLPVGRLTHPLGVQSTAIQENQWIDARVHEFGL